MVLEPLPQLILDGGAQGLTVAHLGGAAKVEVAVQPSGGHEEVRTQEAVAVSWKFPVDGRKMIGLHPLPLATITTDL